MQEFQYKDRPKDQNPGVCFLRICPKDQQAPTHMPNGLDTIYWCKQCGMYLGLHDMDDYFQREGALQ
jgi:hypothetical protein